MTPYHAWRSRFAEAMDGSSLFGIEYLDHLFATAMAYLFSTDTAAIVVEFRYYPGPQGYGETVKVIHGLVAAGDMHEIRDVLIPRAEQWGKEHGCSFAMISSREGWARVLSDYSPHQVTLIKEL